MLMQNHKQANVGAIIRNLFCYTLPSLYT